ncbi:MAG: hypothetical protein JRM77_03100 [Nitrososphaerota archaeon]|nr:hypothetical protein [Nitrososphaerota archaeon]
MPQTLPTSNGTRFSAVVVTVIGSTGQPAVAMSNVIVYLASSDTSVLAVQSEVTIPAGHEYALANVTTTLAAGSSTVSALAPGYDGGSALFTTMVPRGYPTALELTALPQMATPGSTGKMAIMVVDQTGEPAQTAAATVVQITSSEPDAVGVLTSKVTIPLGGIVGYGTFAAASVPGSAILTASSPGFNSGATEVTNFVNASAQADQFVSQQPTLQISHILGDLPADGKTYSAMVVSLVNPAANPCPLSGGVAPPTCPYMAPSPVTVLLTSSFPDVAEVPGSVIIPQGGTSAMVNLTTTVTAGFSNITASASDYIPASAKVTTAMMPQVKIGLYVSEPDVLVSQVEHSANVVVQLQDAFGFPVRARAPVSAVLSFSNSTITGFPMDVVVPTGADMVAVNVNLTAAATGTFGVISQGLAAATASFQATMAPISVELSSAHSSMYTNETSALQFTATYDNLPITGLSLSWTATGGSLSNSTTVTGATGTSSVVFKPSGTGVANITVSGNSAAVGPISKHMYIQVLQAQANAKPSILQLLMKYIIYIVPAAGGGAALAFFLIRRRRKGGSSSDEEE